MSAATQQHCWMVHTGYGLPKVDAVKDDKIGVSNFAGREAGGTRHVAHQMRGVLTGRAHPGFWRPRPHGEARAHTITCLSMRWYCAEHVFVGIAGRYTVYFARLAKQ